MGYGRIGRQVDPRAPKASDPHPSSAPSHSPSRPYEVRPPRTPPVHAAAPAGLVNLGIESSCALTGSDLEPSTRLANVRHHRPCMSNVGLFSSPEPTRRAARDTPHMSVTKTFAAYQRGKSDNDPERGPLGPRRPNQSGEMLREDSMADCVLGRAALAKTLGV